MCRCRGDEKGPGWLLLCIMVKRYIQVGCRLAGAPIIWLLSRRRSLHPQTRRCAAPRRKSLSRSTHTHNRPATFLGKLRICGPNTQVRNASGGDWRSPLTATKLTGHRGVYGCAQNMYVIMLMITHQTVQ